MTYFLEVVHHGVETGDLADVVADQEEQTARQVRLCAANHRIVEKEIEHLKKKEKKEKRSSP